ncbi:hypothetical protein TFLX_05255 [Thermoflexales bacterium]|nr:hypothetical protein TFLX_05255 [Thermoflexales bacterium]
MDKPFSKPPTEYQSYLLRLWRSNKRHPWRAMLEQVGSEERHSFTDLEGLFAFLHAQTTDDQGENRQKTLTKE